MNETYWIVVAPNGDFAMKTLASKRTNAMSAYTWIIRPQIRHPRTWDKEYRKGARCKKVRLVLEE